MDDKSNSKERHEHIHHGGESMDNDMHQNHQHMEHDHMNDGGMDHDMNNNHQHMESGHMKDSNMDHDMHGGHSGHGGHDHHDHHAMMVKDFKRRFFISLIITVPILVLSPMIQGFLGIDLRFTADSYILFALATVLFFYGGKPFFTGARDELKQKSPAMMTLIAFAIGVAYIYSSLTIFVLRGGDFFWELATLIVIMLLGHWIEMRSIMGASKALDELVKLMPEEAHLIKQNGETQDVPVDELKPGDSVLVKPGEKIPIDGSVFEGESDVNEAMITGESVPVRKGKGDEIIGGSVNGDGILKFKVGKVGEDTFISQVIKLVRDAQASKSNTQRLADKAAKLLFYIAMSAGIVTALVWAFIGKDVNFVIERAVTVIIICCPHALGLAIPLVTSVSTSIAARSGLLIRNRAAFENARKLNAVVFDKTGTLTKGEFGVTDVIPKGVSEDELISLAYSVEANSEHPIAQGVVRYAKEKKTQLKLADNYKSMPGKGLKAKVDGKDIFAVSPGYLSEENIEYDIETYEKLSEQGKTVMFILAGNELLGMIALSDIIRDSAKEAVDTLRSMNVESIMLTGDNKRAASYVGSRLGIDTIISEVLPQQKASNIDELKDKGRIVAMTGDGVNDAPSLAKADLGIAIGAGTDVAIETADVILVKSNPKDVVNILKLSKAIYRKMIQNLAWATGYNAVALPLAAGVLFSAGITLSPAVGAVLMSISTIIVAINARLLKIK